MDFSPISTRRVYFVNLVPSVRIKIDQNIEEKRRRKMSALVWTCWKRWNAKAGSQFFKGFIREEHNIRQFVLIQGKVTNLPLCPDLCKVHNRTMPQAAKYCTRYVCLHIIKRLGPCFAGRQYWLTQQWSDWHEWEGYNSDISGLKAVSFQSESNTSHMLLPLVTIQQWGGICLPV